MTTFDVYAFGVVSASTLYTTTGPFPAAEGYAEIDCQRHMTGGEATNSSIVLARLGARVRLDGNWLGDDQGGRRTRALIDAFGIDTEALPLRQGVTSVQEIVIAAGRTRTIFGTYVQMHSDKNWNVPDKADLARARVICLDPFFGEASARVARIGAEASIPVVTVDCRHDSSLLADIAALVISESFLRENYAGQSPQDVFDACLNSTPGLVVFTFGDREVWYGRPGQSMKTLKSYAVDAIDTAGAGDSFRAGVVYGLLQGWDDDRLVDFSAALAAIVCTRSPGVLDAPGYDEVVQLMREART